MSPLIETIFKIFHESESVPHFQAIKGEREMATNRLEDIFFMSDILLLQPLVSVNTKLRYTYWGESVEKGRDKQLGGKEKQ